MHFRPDTQARWRPLNRWRSAELPPPWYPWLADTGSLTRRLTAVCRGTFSVRVLAQGPDRPGTGEAALLALRPRQRVWVREVQLCCDGQPWVFARTLVPAATLAGRGRRLTRLGSRSLGEVLFTDPTVSRGAVEVARLGPGSWLYRRAAPAGGPPCLWGRRSLFWLAGRPLLVCEVFLPPLPVSDSQTLTHCHGPSTT